MPSNISDIGNESNLRITAENIGTIGSYEYGSSTAARNTQISGAEILSYAEPGSIEFRPLVYLSLDVKFQDKNH